MPINSIDLINFQPYRNTHIDFHKGMNVITGTSDVGKSAVLKAFLWVKDGRPLGDVVKNWDSKDSDPVIVKIDKDGILVSKVRENGTNWYEIKYPDSSKVKKFEAVKTNVPQEVQDIFNMKDINVQTQHDPYHLINMTPGQAAAKLNEFAHLDIIGVLYKNVNRKINSAKKESEDKKREAETKQKEIDSLSFIDDARSDIEVIEKLEEIYQEEARSLEKLKECVNEVLSYEEQIHSHKEVLSIEKIVNALNKAVTEYQTKEAQLNLLKSSLDSIYQLTNKIADERDWLCVESHLSELNGLTQRWTNLKNGLGELKTSLAVVKQSENNLVRNKEVLSTKKEILTKLLKKEKKCPLCFSDLDNNAILRMV